MIDESSASPLGVALSLKGQKNQKSLRRATSSSPSSFLGKREGVCVKNMTCKYKQFVAITSTNTAAFPNVPNLEVTNHSVINPGLRENISSVHFSV